MRKVSDLSNFTLPHNVWKDINKRITDWVSMGGKESDPYIQRQIEYAERVHKIYGNSKSTF